MMPTCTLAVSFDPQCGREGSLAHSKWWSCSVIPGYCFSILERTSPGLLSDASSTPGPRRSSRALSIDRAALIPWSWRDRSSFCQELSRPKNRCSFKWRDIQEVGVSRNYAVSLGCQCSFKKLIIFRVTAGGHSSIWHYQFTEQANEVHQCCNVIWIDVILGSETCASQHINDPDDDVSRIYYDKPSISQGTQNIARCVLPADQSTDENPVSITARID